MAAAEHLLDPLLGIVPRVYPGARQAGDPNFFHYYAEETATGALYGVENFAGCGGASRDRDGALAKTLGEGVERYCAALYRPEELPLCTYEGAPFRCTEPESFALYRPEQYRSPGFAFVPFSRKTPVRWFPALDALTFETVHVPAAAVFVPYCYDVDGGEPPIMQPISTGLACHESYESACVAALCEVIERDAFTIVWLAMIAPRRIRTGSLEAAAADLVARLHRSGYGVTIFDATTDIGVPVILSVARHDADSEPAFVIAAAAHPDANVALRKSLEELEHTRSWAKKLKSRLPPVEPGRQDALDSQADHIRFWCDRDNAKLGSFLFASPDECDVHDLPSPGSSEARAQLRSMLRAIDRAALRPLFCDLTTPDVRQLGLRVVRAVVPGLHPLTVGHRVRALGGRRLYDVPARLGFPVRAPGDTNPAPHPFP